MIVSNIVVSRDAVLILGDNTLIQSGLLTCGTTKIFPAPGTHQFGALKLEAEPLWTKSLLSLPSNSGCIVRFRPSSAVPWNPDAMLTVSNWIGGPFGGGMHQVRFGETGDGLSAQQLSQIRFRNPSGHFPGLYPAKIVPDGEIVPDVLPPTGRAAPMLQIARVASDYPSISVTVFGESGATYAIETSSNMLQWSPWRIAQATTNGLVWFQDYIGPGPRFYRAFLLP